MPLRLLTIWLLVCGCTSSTPETPDPDPENTEQRCSDAVDNDRDQAIDCDDSDCEAFCITGPETDCDDLFDNDNDGEIDCRDPDCSDDPHCVEGEDSLVECSDGLDNDFDELLDCADPDCMPQIICGPEFGGRACTDLFDNDGDGDRDCNDDDCATEPACSGIDVEDTDDLCSDRVDNDGDAEVDCQDLDCRDAGVAGCAAEEDGPLCGDKLDNDGDDLIDCLDSGCDDAIACGGGQNENTVDLCGNTLDDDFDGYADCGDIDCLNNPEVTFCGLEQGQRCADDIDNDGDTKIDCDDADCTGAPDCANTEPEDSTRTCSDLVDNDGDFMIDCADTECHAQAFCIFEATPAVCSDGFDNDGDANIDCDDSGCAVLPLCTPESLCQNGLDDDDDGFTDCADDDCNPGVYCGEEVATAFGFCDDTYDNDNDGLIDCADPGCADEPRCQTAPDEVCDNLTDDDGDDRVDCDDLDCLLDFTVTSCDAPHPSDVSRLYSVSQLQNVTDQTFPPTRRGDAVDDPVRLRGVIVTFVDPDDSSRFYVADPGDSTCGPGLTGCYRGLRVEINQGQPSGHQAGDLVDLAGLLTEFTGETGVIALAWQGVGTGAALPMTQLAELYQLNDPLPFNEKNNDRFETNPSTGVVIDPEDDTLTAERYEGMLVTLTDVEVSAVNSDSYVVFDPADPGAGEMTVGTRYVQLEGPPNAGASIDSVTGILHYQRWHTGLAFVSEYLVEPRDAADWDFASGFVDSDGDGLTDDEEALVGTDPNDFDTDRDEYSDGVEIGDPSNPNDVDNDGINDALEAFDLDRDGDDIPDEFDAVNLDGPDDDRDGDGISNLLDPDDDNDGICDPGVPAGSFENCGLLAGEADNCPFAPEPIAGNGFLQQNQDENLVAEMTEFGILLGDQYDNSGSGDACDWDIDGDTFPNPWDNCPYDFNYDQADEDHDGFGDPCDAVPAGDTIQTNFTPFVCIDPSDGGRGGCDLIIEEVMYYLSSSGGAQIPDTNRDGAPSVVDDELVEIRNVSGVALDLSGLELHDWASAPPSSTPVRHVIPSGTILRHNQRLLVFGGGAPQNFDSRIAVQTASSGSLGLSNGPDGVFLLDPSTGAQVAALPYGDTSIGEPESAKNVSLTRYPDGVLNWVSHPARGYSVGGQTFELSASPGQAPDNQQQTP